VGTTHFWNNLHPVSSKSKDWKAKSDQVGMTNMSSNLWMWNVYLYALLIAHQNKG
jgi:hypothetical protein